MGAPHSSGGGGSGGSDSARKRRNGTRATGVRGLQLWIRCCPASTAADVAAAVGMADAKGAAARAAAVTDVAVRKTLAAGDVLAGGWPVMLSCKAGELPGARAVARRTVAMAAAAVAVRATAVERRCTRVRVRARVLMLVHVSWMPYGSARAHAGHTEHPQPDPPQWPPYPPHTLASTPPGKPMYTHVLRWKVRRSRRRGCNRRPWRRWVRSCGSSSRRKCRTGRWAGAPASSSCRWGRGCWRWCRWRQ